jgi:sugar O-acyltransferase (sialic acid O-acetyltransferase NeuD family)
MLIQSGLPQPTDLVIIGGGGHARVVWELFEFLGRGQVRGFVDTHECIPTTAAGLTHLGDDGYLLSNPGCRAVIGFGSLQAWHSRMAAVVRLNHCVADWATGVHPHAYVSGSARLGVGVVVMAGAIVQAGVIVGDHSVINSGAVVEHDVELGQNVHVAPGSVIGGGTNVGSGTFLGLGASIRNSVSIGAQAVVAMGSVVIRSVGAGEHMKGVPARRMDEANAPRHAGLDS